jgi:hypothetical protein
MAIERLDASSCILLFFILLRGLTGCCWRGLLQLLLRLLLSVLLRVPLLLLLRLAIVMTAISERLLLFLGGLLPLPLPTPLLGFDMLLFVLLGVFCDAPPPLRKLQLLEDLGPSLFVGDSATISQRGVFMFCLLWSLSSLVCLPLDLVDVVASHLLGCCCR